MSNQSDPDVPAAQPAGPAPQASAPRASLPLWKKLLFSLIACGLFFGLLELLLAAAGVRRMKYDEDPYVGFTSQIPLYVERPGSDGMMETAANKRSWFNLQSFPERKPSNTYRIFCVGGSTTFGRPYDDTTSYCGWLREFLKAADPSRHWEVINAGGISYASYRVAVLMEELVEYEPDLILIYTGHNEFLERRTYSTVVGTPAAVRGLGAVLSGTRTFSALHRIIHSRSNPPATTLSSEVDTILDGSVGLDAYRRDDKLQQQVLEHYRYNLQRMVDMARSAGADAMFVTPASNLRDCGPFKSEHRTTLSEAELQKFQALYQQAESAFAEEKFDDALAALDRANEIDDRYAALHYLRGRTLDRLGRTSEAREAFQKARDEDVCPLRALTAAREIVTRVAAERDVPLVDFCDIVERRSEDGIPGENLFLDHVHPTIEGHRILALALLDELKTQGVVTPGPDWNDHAMARVIDSVNSRVDTAAHSRALTNLAQVLSWAGKHEESGKLAVQAVEMTPENAEANYLAGSEFARRGNLAQAQAHFERCLALDPDARVALRAYDNLGLVFLQQGRLSDAEEQYRKAIQIDPNSARLYNNLGMIAAQQNNLAQAVEYFEHSVRIEPQFAMGHYNLAIALAQRGNTAAAVEQLQQVLEIQPHYPEARERLRQMQMLLQQGR